MKIAGIILIVLGILALVYQYIPYTETKQDLKIGSLEVDHQEHHAVWVPPVIGGVLIVGGVAALVLGGRSKL
jgi:uncharacterized membrane protein YidH (DUF202 family)